MKKETRMFTYQTRVSVHNELSLQAYAKLFSKLERKLLADLMAKKNSVALKREYIQTYEVTARQFNALLYQVKGKIASAEECQKTQMDRLKKQITSLSKEIPKLKKKPHRAKVVFGKNNRLTRLKKTLTKLEGLHKKEKVSICFGGRKLFREQFELEEKELPAWKKRWEEARSNSFFSMGSKEETAGNQSCTLIKKEDKLSLRVRLPHALEKEYGKYLVIDNLEFKYGHKQILEALKEARAISYRFIYNKKGWRVFVSFAETKKPIVTRKEQGAIGIDINVDHLAATEIDRFGNKVCSERFSLNLYGKDKNQRSALIEEMTKKIVQLAQEKQLPIVLEDLDFQKKKESLRKDSAKKARMLSSFSYEKILSGFESKCFKAGVEILKVNPAYTSMLGDIKYKKSYGLSTHTAAALCIARRGLGYLEKLPFGKEMTLLTKEGSKLLFQLPARNVELDNYETLKEVRRGYKAAHAAHIRAEKTQVLRR